MFVRSSSNWNWSTGRKISQSKDENQQQTQPTYDTGTGSRTRATLVGGELSNHCSIPAPPKQRQRLHDACTLFNLTEVHIIPPPPNKKHRKRLHNSMENLLTLQCLQEPQTLQLPWLLLYQLCLMAELLQLQD